MAMRVIIKKIYGDLAKTTPPCVAIREIRNPRDLSRIIGNTFWYYDTLLTAVCSCCLTLTLVKHLSPWSHTEGVPGIRYITRK